MHTPPLHAIDFYKSGHYKQMPDNTSLIYLNQTPRSTRRKDCNFIIFFGLQYFLIDVLVENWNRNFFNRPLEDVLYSYQRRMNNALGYGVVTTDHIAKLHKLGYLPLCIKALPEGSKVPLKVPVLTMYNTVEHAAWLPGYLETCMSRSLWIGSTSATTAFLLRRQTELFYKKTVGNPFGQGIIMKQVHDFSSRGMIGDFGAQMSGAAHLLSHEGTDSVDAIDFLERYYYANCDNEVVGTSVPATEHSVMCMGMEEGELETIRRLITQIYPTGPISIVIDTWDYWRNIGQHIPLLKEEIINRQGTVILRPDTGDPADIIAGFVILKDLNILGMMKIKSGKFIFEGQTYQFDKKLYEEVRSEFGEHYDYNPKDFIQEIEVSPEEAKGTIHSLYDIIGGTENPLGFKELHPNIGCIFGDSITLEVQLEIFERLEAKKFASTNVFLGVGSFTYQYVTRDTDGWAVKATYGEVMEEMKDSKGRPYKKAVGRNIFKAPKTGDGTKNSATGLLAVHTNEEGDYYLKEQCTWEEERGGDLETVFLNGKILRETSLQEIRRRINNIL